MSARRGGPDLLLLLHGLGCTREYFQPALTDPAFDDLSVWTFDFPSHGGSDPLDHEAAAIDLYADLTNEIVRRVGPRRVVMACHSMGNAVGLVASQTMTNIDGYIAIEGNLVSTDCGVASRGLAEQSPTEFVAHGFSDFGSKIASSELAGHRAWARWWRNAEPHGLHLAARSLVEWCDSGKLLDIYRSLPRRAYIYGEHSALDHVLPLLADTTTICVPGSGHFPMTENGADFWSAMRQLVLV